MDGPGARARSLCATPIVYIAGRFRGPTDWDRAENVRLAQRFGLAVAYLGAMPLIPQANTGLFFGQLSEETFWIPGTLRLAEVSDGMVLIPGWRQSQGARGERYKWDEWGRSDRLFLLDEHPIEDVAKNADYERLRAWIDNFKRAA